MTEYQYISELQSEFSARKDAIRPRLIDFAAVRPEGYFYELAYCLLTPQSSAVHAERAVEELRLLDFKEGEIDPIPVLRRKEQYIRFHNTKARHLSKAKAQFPEIMSQLLAHPAHAEEGERAALRLWLTQNVRGLGWKEASHFLRNIGYRHLAILDRHILRNLCRHGVLDAVPASLSPKRYVEIEEKFSRFASLVGIDMDEMDLLFWSRETGEIRK